MVSAVDHAAALSDVSLSLLFFKNGRQQVYQPAVFQSRAIDHGPKPVSAF